jgi:hypothetical protein
MKNCIQYKNHIHLVTIYQDKWELGTWIEGYVEWNHQVGYY